MEQLMSRKHCLFEYDGDNEDNDSIESNYTN